MRSPRLLDGFLLCLLIVVSVCGCQDRDRREGYVPWYPRAVKTAIDPALQQAARAEIKTALDSNDDVIRAHALETLADLQMTDWSSEIVELLGDRSSLVRKAAAYAAGQLRVASARDRLPELLDAEASATPQEVVTAKQERLAAIFALHQLGITTYSHEFEQSAVDPRPMIRRDTAFILGLIGNKSAIPMLHFMLHNDNNVDVRLEAAEALWRMGDEQGETALVEGTVSQYPDDKMICILALAEPRDQQVLGNIEGFFNDDYPEVRLVSARAAGMLGEDLGYGIAMRGAASQDPRQRLLAALAFGDIDRSDAQPRLKKLLLDSDPDVQIAAAKALLEIAQRQ